MVMRVVEIQMLMGSKGGDKMKRVYEAPIMEIELYELDTNIASNCGDVVNMGPEGPGAEDVCKDYYDKAEEPYPESATWSRAAHNIDFWTEESCSCYYSASGTFFTS